MCLMCNTYNKVVFVYLFTVAFTFSSVMAGIFSASEDITIDDDTNAS